jgi:hypothetical protein
MHKERIAHILILVGGLWTGLELLNSWATSSVAASGANSPTAANITSTLAGPSGILTTLDNLIPGATSLPGGSPAYYILGAGLLLKYAWK